MAEQKQNELMDYEQAFKKDLVIISTSEAGSENINMNAEIKCEASGSENIMSEEEITVPETASTFNPTLVDDLQALVSEPVLPSKIPFTNLLQEHSSSVDKTTEDVEIIKLTKDNNRVHCGNFTLHTDHDESANTRINIQDSEKEETNVTVDNVELTCNTETILENKSHNDFDPPYELNSENQECSSTNEKINSLFNFDSVPFQITGAWGEFEKIPNNFLKGCKWAPDGSCVLTNSDDNYLRIFNLPDVFYNQGANWENITEMKSVVKVKEGELIYDFCWYPLMTSMDPSTCSFVCTSRNNAIHMFDGYTGDLRCSYRAYSHVDEIDSAYSLNFSSDGQKLFCGFNKIIRIFDVNVPGRTYEERKTKIMGQYGIISCIAINPAASNIYAAGSYLRSVGLYAEADGSLICLLEGQQGGITHIMFSLDGTKIFTGGRKDPEILCWDLRNPGEILFSLQRNVQTNQRMYFDMDSSGRYLLSGNNDGKISVWDIATATAIIEDEPIVHPILSYFAHDDCVNGVSLHPTLPLLVTASGQRKFPEPADSDDSDTDTFTDKHVVYDNSLRLWWCGQPSQE